MFFVVLVKPMYQTKVWVYNYKRKKRKYRVVICSYSVQAKRSKSSPSIYNDLMSNIWNRALIVWNFRFGLPSLPCSSAPWLGECFWSSRGRSFYCQKKQTKRWELCGKKTGHDLRGKWQCTILNHVTCCVLDKWFIAIYCVLHTICAIIGIHIMPVPVEYCTNRLHNIYNILCRFLFHFLYIPLFPKTATN